MGQEKAVTNLGTRFVTAFFLILRQTSSIVMDYHSYTSLI